MEAEERRIEERRERRRIRRERRLKRGQEGLPPDDDGNDSSDSGYSGRSTTTLVKEEEEEERSEEKHEERGDDRRDEEEDKPRTPRMRKVFDLDGNLLYEEEIAEPRGPGEESQEEETDAEGRRMKKKRVLKRRQYIRDRTLPDGTVVQEMVESDYWDSDSEESEVSRPGSVTAQIDQARLKRKKDRRDMMNRSTGSTVPSLVTRPTAEKHLSPERTGVTLPRIFHRFARGKRKISDDPEPIREIPDSDRFLPQYHVKKETEGRLEDEGFWDDPAAKKTALEIFDFDNLENQLAVSVSPPPRNSMSSPTSSADVPSGEEINKHAEKKEEVKQPRRGILSSGKPRRPKSTRLPEIERPSGFISGSHDDAIDDVSSTLDNHKNEQNEMTARVCRLLTERLFPSEEGRVIQVQERPTSAHSISKTHSRKSSVSSFPHPHQPDDRMSTDDVGVFHTSKSLDLPPLAAHRFTPRGGGGGRTGRTSLLRYGLRHDRSLVSRLIRSPGPPREAWGDPETEPEVSKSHLKTGRQDESVYDEEERDSRGTIDYQRLLDMDEARLKRLLEELYKDKKYMDALLAAEAASHKQEVKLLAEYGRNYLLQMADYWELKGPLPPRPSTTALGFKMERARTAHAQRAQTAVIAEVNRQHSMIN